MFKWYLRKCQFSNANLSRDTIPFFNTNHKDILHTLCKVACGPNNNNKCLRLCRILYDFKSLCDLRNHYLRTDIELRIKRSIVKENGATSID